MLCSGTITIKDPIKICSIVSGIATGITVEENHSVKKGQKMAYIDPGTAIVTSKSVRGRDLKALERPGLWNGAMAGWNTLFVEVPLATFTPVKSVLDLLRPEHQ